MSPFDYLKSINEKNVEFKADASLDGYNQYIINTALSYHIDTVLQVNQLNTLGIIIPDRQHYDYLFNTVRKRRRYAKWNKNHHDQNLEAVKDYFQYNAVKAKQAMDVLNDQQLQQIIKIMDSKQNESSAKDSRITS